MVTPSTRSHHKTEVPAASKEDTIKVNEEGSHSHHGGGVQPNVKWPGEVWGHPQFQEVCTRRALPKEISHVSCVNYLEATV